MKLIPNLIFLLAITGPVNLSVAQDTQGITVSFQNVPLKQVLRHLSDKYNLKFSYSEDLVELSKNIQVKVDHASLNELLQQIFSQANVEYKLVDDQIVIREVLRSVSNVVIRGKIVDSITGVSLPFASVRIDGASVGTASNNDGIFVLTVPTRYENSNLMISHVGYKNLVTSLSALENEMVFRLEQNSIELDAVVVTIKTGSSILEEAIMRLKQNYDTSDVQYTYFIRDVSLLNDAPIGASEILYQAYQGSAGNASTLQQVKFLNGRKIKNFGAVQSILQTFIRWTGFELGFTGNVIFSADLNARPDDNRFPSAKFMRQHKFELLGVSQLDGKEVYVIDFDQKPGIKKSLYKGRLYVDTESLAFSRLEIGLSPRGIEQARFFNTPKAVATLFGYGKCAITDTKTVINYKALNGKWYPTTIEEYWSAALAQPKKEFYSTIEVKGNIVVTDIQTENISPFNRDEVLTGANRNWEYLYRPATPMYLNTIETDAEIQEAFQIIADKNRAQGIDLKFWRRYQPYKSNPSLLARDSLLCLQSEVSDPEHPLQTIPREGMGEKEDEDLHAKYPLLNRSFSSRHFVIHCLQQDSSSALEVAHVLESNYEKVLSEFKLKSLDDVVHVEIYPDVKHYHFAIGKFDAPDSDAGMAVDLNLFKIVSPGNPGTHHTRESLLKGAVHEFSHCVHYHFIERLSKAERDQITNKEEAPWLFEAMASYVAGQFYDPARFEYIVKKQYPPIQILNEVEYNGKIYDLGFVIIDFIKQKWGQEGLIELLQKNGNIHDSFSVSEREFEIQLYHYINAKYLNGQK